MPISTQKTPKKAPRKKVALSRKQAAAASTEAGGRIVTFYSYKGGTGRSMAVANVAWLLASAGKKVLVLDWDFEAPGLHRYFRPFLDDPELVETRGLLDFFWEFAEAARIQATLPATRRDDPNWFLPFADLSRYILSLNHEFRGKEATLDVVCAGRQGPAYGLRASTFDWNTFYNKLGGGVFLEHMKRQLRENYDFILIDSRTGLSDTAGICTVQMPDEVMIFFTPNRQSILGASSVADSIRDQRRLPSGAPGIRLWPVATRIDQAEIDRLKSAITLAESVFRGHLWHMKRGERTTFWARQRVPYVAFYSYEEVLATVKDDPGSTGTVLEAMEKLAGRLVGKPALRLSTSAVAQQDRKSLQAAFGINGSTKGRGPAVYVSYSRRDVLKGSIAKLALELQKSLGADVTWDENIPLGVPFASHLQERLRRADVVLFIVGQGWLRSEYTATEMRQAVEQRKRMVPVLLADQITWRDMPDELSSLMGIPIPSSGLAKHVRNLSEALQSTLKAASDEPRQPEVEDDPQKGRWGGRSKVNCRILSAKVKELSKHWFAVDLKVTGTMRRPLAGTVKFHLHDSFPEQEEVVKVVNGSATLKLQCYGAFTVGVEADRGTTQLELDLAHLKGAPKIFRES